MRMLIAEDDPRMAEILRQGFTEAGWTVGVANDGVDAVHLALSEPFDCLVLDVNLPYLDGMEVCRRIRDADVTAPILMLTARDAVPDRVSGLDAGADDYLVKPFAFDELLARIRALSRRATPSRAAVTVVGRLEIDPSSRSVSVDGEPVALSAREFALLSFLAGRVGEVVTRTEILDHVWDVNYVGMSNVVDVYVGYLRSKIDKRFDQTFITTVRGAGYMLAPGS